MNFDLTEEQILIRDAARNFARTELLPGVIERDDKQIFPAEQIKKLGELGFLGMMVSPEYGGGVWMRFHTSWPWKNFQKLMLQLLS